MIGRASGPTTAWRLLADSLPTLDVAGARTYLSSLGTSSYCSLSEARVPAHGFSCFWRPAGDVLRLSRRIRTFQPLHQPHGSEIQVKPGGRPHGLLAALGRGARVRRFRFNCCK